MPAGFMWFVRILKLIIPQTISVPISAPGLKSEVPGIEAASRLNSIGSSVFYTDDKKSYQAEFSLTDENLFDVLPRPVIFGNPKEILKNPMNCMISDEIASMIGGNVTGRMIELKEYPGKMLTIAGIKSLESEKSLLYVSEEGFRTAMFAGSIIILIITLLGLLGYTVTEVSRRGKELALRKINGARLSDILTIFIKDLVYIAIPAVMAGLAGAWMGAQKWMENFVIKTALSPGMFILCGLFVLLFIASISALNYVIISGRNPIETIRYE